VQTNDCSTPLHATASAANPTPDILPTLEQVQHLLLNKYEKLGDTPVFLSDANVQSVLDLMKRHPVRYPDPMPFGLHLPVSLYACARSDCHGGCIGARDTGTRLCASCYEDNRKSQRRQARKRQSEAAGIDRTSASSRAPISSLSPTTKKARIKNVSRERKQAIWKVKRLDQRLKEMVIIDREDNEDFLDMLSEALKDADLRNDIQKELIEQELREKKKDGKDLTEEDRRQIESYSEQISEAINNTAMVIAGKSKQVHCSARITRIAFARWVEYGNGAYERMKENSIEVFPSIRKLQRLQRRAKLEEGYDPNV